VSEENVELVRAAYEAIARRDREALAEILTDHLAQAGDRSSARGP
jgi:DNA-binding GntR family transcriptional regulator